MNNTLQPKSTGIKTVLLVDDDIEDQEIFEIVLNEIKQPVNCVCVKTAEDALATLSKETDEKPDYIFLDLNLPLMSGFECLNALKHNEELHDIPVIIYSTSSRKTDQQKAKELGAVDYFIKPNTFSELKTMLENVFA